MIARSLGGALLGAFLTAVMATPAARAGEIRVSTVRIDLSDRQPAATVTVTNDGAQKSLVQIRVLSWTQEDGKDVQDVTNQLIVTPPIADIDPAGRQMIRVGFIGKRGASAEGAFRLMIEEVPRQDQEQLHSVETYLRISVPIFIASTEAKATPSVTARRAKEEGGELRLYNSGLLHERLISYQLMAGGKAVGELHKGLFYILPGKYLAIPLPPAERMATADSVEIFGDEGKISLPLSPAE
jgi:fimbrial chaperone protein